MGLFPLRASAATEACRCGRYRAGPIPTSCSACRLFAGGAAEVLKALLSWARDAPRWSSWRTSPPKGRSPRAGRCAESDETRLLASNAYTRPILRRALDAETYPKPACPATCAGSCAAARSGSRKRAARARVLRGREELAALDRGVPRAGGERLEGPARQRARLPRGEPPLRRAALHRRVRARAPSHGRPRSRRQADRALLRPGPGEGAIAFKTAFDESLRKFGPGTLALVDLTRCPRAPGLQWMDSYTAPDNEVMGSVWKHRRTVQRVAVATDFAAKPRWRCCPLRLCASLCRNTGRRRAPARNLPSPSPPSPAILGRCRPPGRLLVAAACLAVAAVVSYLL